MIATASQSASHNDWLAANQRYLMARLEAVRDALTEHSARAQQQPQPGTPGGEETSQTHEESSARASDESHARALADAERDLIATSALDRLCDAFSLSPFERDVLLLCAGAELDSAFGKLCGEAQGDARRAYPTFGLALAALAEAHWSALTPAAPLRRWRLIEVSTGETLTGSQLRVDERVLHYLTGVSYLDARLQGLVEPMRLLPGELPASHREIAERVADLAGRVRKAGSWPIVNLCGDDAGGMRAITVRAAAVLQMNAHSMRASDVPVAVAERDALARLWEREAILSNSVLLIDYDEPEHQRAVYAFIENVRAMVLVTSREPLRQPDVSMTRFDVNKPSLAEQRGLWQSVLGAVASQTNGHLETLTAQFNFGANGIRAAGAQALEELLSESGETEKKDSGSGEAGDEALGGLLWDACRAQARSGLDDLAQRIEPIAGWGDIVLPEAQLQTLRAIAAQVRARARVYEEWGFASKGARGLGISALFAGASGTGKTMAAEVIARELRLDLYRIDLSQVVNKYIGETEKNLRRVFDAAEEGGAVLLFDEADALFGKRSEVKDSHDRYANIEISYLLQRMEEYRGLAILTTNLKSVLDPAFLRRLRFVVQFPFPDHAQRALIWHRIFPAETPTENLDVSKLARLNVAGGNIRNIALNAAFLAAHDQESVRMPHLLRAARSEYAKLEKPLSDSEIAGWM